MGARKKDRLCAYCGVKIRDAVGGHTKEHVIPRSLFPSFPGYQPRKDLLTVDACSVCNNSKNVDDAYLRDVLAVRLAALRHPDIQHLIENFAKSATGGKSIFAKTIVHEGRTARDRTTGLFLPHLIEVPIDDERLARILKDLTRALYYKEHKRILASGYQYEIYELPEDMVAPWINLFVKLGVRPYREVGDGQFEYQHALLPEDPDTTIWTLCFFGAIFYGGVTLPPHVSSFSEMYSMLFPAGDESVNQLSHGG